MIKGKVKKYYDRKYDLNCAETIIYAANEEYNMNLSKETLKTMAGFGGGMAIEDTCGAIAGAVAVIGILFTEERAHESSKVKNLTKEFMEKFIDKLGTNNCAQLKNKYRKNEEIRCENMVYTAAEILDQMVLRERS